jgi:sulfatase maturation enzyme AslB (radical SAM superfamily)
MITRVLCLGNNTEDTDVKTIRLAKDAGSVCHGLLSEIDRLLIPNDYSQSGYYHSSIYDVEFGRLLDICNQFDLVIMLDQPKSEWSHPDAFYNTVRLLNSVDSDVKFLDKTYYDQINFFDTLVEKNKSFCIFPFIELLVDVQHTTVCCRSTKPITPINELTNFNTDVNYTSIRNKMLSGEKIPEHCQSCYTLENQGIVSARQQETVEWANRLNLRDLDDLNKIIKPAYYEVRPSNKCNLQCRMCKPKFSHLIAKEYAEIGLYKKVTSQPTRSGFEIIEFDNLQKLYVAGGEPTIMPEFYQFLDQCIETNNTDFEILVNTNGIKFSDKFKQQLKHFSNFQFVFSIDGYRDVNHYIRWPGQWDQLVDNWRYAASNGHKVTVNTTVSIYNIASLDQLFMFVDKEFPGTLVHCQLADNVSPFLFPDAKEPLKSLRNITTLSCYKNDPLMASSIDGYIRHFENYHKENKARLVDFFKFNDQLDKSRNINLQDYIPELYKHRPTSV